MSYVDAVVIPIPEANIEAYKKMVKVAAKIWKDCGALQYIEALADDVPHGKTTDLYRAVKCKEGETVGVALVIYKSRKHRDEVMKKAMADPRMAGQAMPFDGRRMIFGGFKPVVEMTAKPEA